MKSLKVNAGRLLLSICEAAVGILLFKDPLGSTSSIIEAMGILLVIRGAINIITYFRTKPEIAARGHNLSAGFICITAGLFCAFRSGWFAMMFPALTFFYGVIILLAGVMKIQWTVDAVRQKRKRWFPALLSAVLSLVSAFVIITNPFASTEILWTFAAVSLLVEAVLDLIAVFCGGEKS